MIQAHSFPRLWTSDLPGTALAARYGVTKPALSTFAKRRGLPPRGVRAPHWTGEHDAVLRAMWPAHSAREIAAVVGRGRNAVIGRARRLGLGRAR